MCGLVGEHIDDNLVDHLLQFVQERACFVGAFFYLTQFLFPKSGQFRALEQLFMNRTDQFFPGSGRV